MDADLAKSLGLSLQKCTPVPVAGIGSRHLSSAFVSFDVFFRGVDNVARIPIEAHLVENLKAKLLIGMDIMGHEGFRLDFDAKTVKIPSCMGLEVPVSLHSKPHHAAQRAVFGKLLSSRTVTLLDFETAVEVEPNTLIPTFHEMGAIFGPNAMLGHEHGE
ncbi:hypothetical protein N7516_004662 [Penicillium verrucosum]|uniref:uncharacterized protein n=1 Tax=Penicillium verrucosum TaxID=60171 RepID=UPI002544DD27|nr:uncharacterized protein N7516_004662 [Penicillium verrucosum]KAJ5944494.1 hypothetical protein N7516_004662 [Penicillium verrucosum]